jgi:hypothetical protein
MPGYFACPSCRVTCNCLEHTGYCHDVKYCDYYTSTPVSAPRSPRYPPSSSRYPPSSSRASESGRRPSVSRRGSHSEHDRRSEYVDPPRVYAEPPRRPSVSRRASRSEYDRRGEYTDTPRVYVEHVERPRRRPSVSRPRTPEYARPRVHVPEFEFHRGGCSFETPREAPRRSQSTRSAKSGPEYRPRRRDSRSEPKKPQFTGYAYTEGPDGEIIDVNPEYGYIA